MITRPSDLILSTSIKQLIRELAYTVNRQADIYLYHIFMELNMNL